MICQKEKYSCSYDPESDSGSNMSVELPSGPLEERMNLFSKRLKLLGSKKLQKTMDEGNYHIKIDRCNERIFLKLLKNEGITDKIEKIDLSQAYALHIEKEAGNGALITIIACNDPGLFYGFLSLTQLVEANYSGQIVFPEIKIIDYPETARRLAKVSATRDSSDKLTEFAGWLSLFKMNMIGLQFHGQDSKSNRKFMEDINTFCSRANQKKLIESIIYFYPFRGEQFDFRIPEERNAYVILLNEMLDAGAQGVEIDYNDWGNETEVPIEEVLNFAAEGLKNRNPKPIILFCPPQKGDFTYRGPATDEAARVFSQTPENIWPLWVGAPRFKDYTHPKFHNWILTPQIIETWTNKTGRKPFLWINRVSVNTENSFSIEVPGIPGAFAFNGHRLPTEPGKYFEGIHFNCGTRLMTDETEMAYFATAADFIWNPHDWDPVVSYLRAKRFIEIMTPLMEKN